MQYDGEVTIKTELDTKDFEKQIEEVEYQLKELEYELAHAKELKLDKKTIREYELQVEKLNNKLVDLRKKQSEIGKIDLSNISSTMSNIIRKVTKWGLAIFSVRSAYMFIRQSVSTLSQYDEKLANDLEYIRYALASTLQPIIKWIVNAVKSLLYYINYISKAWFGEELFTSASDFENMKKSSKGVANNVKEIKKQLAGFDEMNILQENGIVSSSGTGITAPDLSSWEKIKIPEWIQWIADHQDLFKKIGKYLLIAFGANTLLKLNKFIGSATAGTGLAGIAGLLQTISTLAMLAITIYVVGEAYKDIKEVEQAMKDVNKQYDELKEQEQKHIETEKEIRDVLIKKIKANELSDESIERNINLLRDRIDIGNSTIDMYKKEMDNMSAWEKLTSGNYQRYRQQLQLNIDKVNEEIHTLYDLADVYDYDNDKLKKYGFSTQDLIEIMENQITKIEEINKDTSLTSEEYQNNIDKIIDLKKKINDITKSEIQNEIDKLEEKNKKLKDSPVEYQKNIDKINQLKEKLKELDKIDPTVEVQIEADTKQAEKATRNWADALGETFGVLAEAGINTIKGKGSWKDFTSKLKNIWSSVKFAKGGIISLPGKGVPLAIGGEGGTTGSQEGVIPLTDAQQMELLGEAIGKNVVIYLTNITKLDNRQLAREQKIINTRNEFTTNS